MKAGTPAFVTILLNCPSTGVPWVSTTALKEFYNNTHLGPTPKILWNFSLKSLISGRSSSCFRTVNILEVSELGPR